MKKYLLLDQNKNYAILVKEQNEIDKINEWFANYYETFTFKIIEPSWFYINNNLPKKFKFFGIISKDNLTIKPITRYKEMNYQVLTFPEYLIEIRKLKLKNV